MTIKRGILLLLLTINSAIFAQEIIPFKLRKQENLRGGLRMIGNNVVNNQPSNMAYHGDETNDRLRMSYIDVDNDATTFSSSAASLNLSSTCSKVKYAGLYWGGMYDTQDSTKNNIKIKIPSKETYIDLEADTYIYDSFTATQTIAYNPYVCYKDITHILTDENPIGEYVVANVRATETLLTEKFGGTSAGWLLVIIYEDPSQTTKNISTFDGYASIETNNNIPMEMTFTFSGFKTLPAPLPVKARFGIAALEGDKQIKGDRLSILRPNGSYMGLSNDVNPTNNFFNSSISYENSYMNDRRPASTNSLGWDIDLFSIENSNNSVIGNNQTSANFKASTTGDKFDVFFSAFEVEVIEPKMNLLKTVEDVSQNVLNKQIIPLGTTVYYGLEFQNVGNDDAIDYSITDILPKNVTFDTTIPVEIPVGVTYSLTTTTNGETQLIFTVPNALVTEGSAKQKIRFAVKLSNNCNDFSTICSETVVNKAYSIYKGMKNSEIINDLGSYSEINPCNIGVPEETIFYVDISGCTPMQQTELFCGENKTLTAESGYDSYVWTNGSGQVVSNSQKLIITQGGQYTVAKTKKGCLPRKEIYDMNTTIRQEYNPIVPYTTTNFKCEASKISFPQVFICGATASITFDLNTVSNVTSIEWQKHTGETLKITENCPPTDSNWQQIHIGKSIAIAEEGIYKVLLTFTNGCTAPYFFRVHTSPINPTVSTENISCNPGKINVLGISGNYEFAVALSGTNPTNYQENPSFKITKNGNYTVYIRKKERLASDCTIEVPNVIIKDVNLNLESEKVTNETCFEQNDASFSFQIKGGTASYTIILTNQNTGNTENRSVMTEGVITFDHLAPANYLLSVTDALSCVVTRSFTVTAAANLDFIVSQEQACEDNESISYLILDFVATNLDVNKLSYSLGESIATQTFDKLSKNRAYIHQRNLSNETNQQITIHYDGCSIVKNIDFEKVTSLNITQVQPTKLLSAIEFNVNGGSGNHTIYYNGVPSDEYIYYFKSTDIGYTDANGNSIKKVSVRIEDDLGCYFESQFEALFVDIELPNYFTPDGDGVNDTWGVRNASGYPKLRLDIIDRHGRTLKILRRNETWDGTYKGKKMPSGDYWYILRLNWFGTELYRGNLTLYR